MKKYGLELMLGCLLLVSFLILSKQAAEVSETMSSTENSKIILVDAGHGGADPGMIGVNGLEEKIDQYCRYQKYRNNFLIFPYFFQNNPSSFLFLSKQKEGCSPPFLLLYLSALWTVCINICLNSLCCILSGIRQHHVQNSIS